MIIRRIFLLVLISFCLMLFVYCRKSAKKQPDVSQEETIREQPEKQVVLTRGSWRTENVEQMNTILSKCTELYPNITIRYDPTLNTEYNAALEAQLSNQCGPDIFYLRSYATSRLLYEKGYLVELTDVEGLMKNFSPEVRIPWASENGTPYGIPFIATSHGIYYNKDIFHNLNIRIPTQWRELLDASEKIQKAVYIPFANATGDPWTIAELMFMNIAPSFIGGREGRMAYLKGERCFNDKHIVSVFQALEDLSPYLPENDENINYTDSINLFLNEQAAMWMGGSWDIPHFEAETPSFSWSVFAIPAPEGNQSVVTFQLDAGIGLNVASPYKKEAMLFLEWMTTQEFAGLLGNTLPGFSPCIKLLLSWKMSMQMHSYV